MITISAPSYALTGTVVLQEELNNSDLRTVTRRVSRSQTLDGGAVIDDAGFSDGDRTIVFSIRQCTEIQYTTLEQFVELYERLLLATVDGVFYGSIEQMSVRGGKVQIRFLAESKLSA